MDKSGEELVSPYGLFFFFVDGGLEDPTSFLAIILVSQVFTMVKVLISL